MTVADVPHRKLEANSAQLGDLRSWLAYAGLYGFLVLYSIAYKYFLSNQLLNFRGDFLFVDDLRATDYWFVIFLTPLAILPIGSRIRSAGQYLVGLLDIFIFIPIPIVFLALLPSPQFWTVYAFLWTGIFISNALSQFELPVGMVQLQPRSFKRVLAIVLVFIGIELLVLARAGIHFVALADVAEARAETSIGTVGGYAIYSYVCAFGGLAMALGILHRRVWLIVLATVGFALCFGILAIKTAALAPFWVIYFYLGKRFFKERMWRYMLLLALPFLASVLASYLTSGDSKSILYDGITLINFRLFVVPAEAFGVYYNFFQTHPHTYWSHINIVQLFVRYPFGTSLGAVMNDTYRLGNYNAAFVETDGIAGGGVESIPGASAVFGLFLMILNSSTRGLNAVFIAMLMALPAMTLIDAPLGTAIVTSGIGTLILLCFLAPRADNWHWGRRLGKSG